MYSALRPLCCDLSWSYLLAVSQRGSDQILSPSHSAYLQVTEELNFIQTGVERVEFYLSAWLSVYRCTCHWLKGFNIQHWLKRILLNCTLRVIQGPQKYLSTHLFICLHFIYLFTHLFMHLFGYLFTLLFIHLFACLFVCLFICTFVCIYAFIFIFSFVYLITFYFFTWLFSYLFTHLFVFTPLFVHLFFTHLFTFVYLHICFYVFVYLFTHLFYIFAYLHLKFVYNIPSVAHFILCL